MRINKPIIGFIIGAMLPLLGFFIVFFILRGGKTFEQFVSGAMAYNRLAALYITLSILINAIPFAIFNSKRLDYAARGVFIATMLYAVWIVLLRFAWS